MHRCSDVIDKCRNVGLAKSGAFTMLPHTPTSEVRYPSLLLLGGGGGLHLIGQLGQRSWKGWTVQQNAGGEGWDVEAEVAAAKHGGSNASHDRLSLNVEVAVDFVGPPASDEADAIGTDTATEKRHRAARTGGGIEVGQEGDSLADEGGDVGRKDKVPRTPGGPKGVDGRRGGGACGERNDNNERLRLCEKKRRSSSCQVSLERN